MNKIAFIALVAGLGVSTSALAADLGVINSVAPTAYIAPAGFDWTGFYAGINGGYGWAEIEEGGATFDDIEGIFGGAQVGYNYDFGGLVLGAEADFQFSGIDYEETIGGIDVRLGIDSFGTARVRVGAALDRLMPYVTGGVAWANTSATAGFGGFVVGVEDTHVGWTAGAGLEYAATDNITVKAEYLYADFGDADYGVGADLNLTASVARVGVNFKF